MPPSATDPSRPTGTGSHPPREPIISPARAGEANRGRVLEALHMRGPRSRAELARDLGVNRATVTTILQPLFDHGMLVEGEGVTRARTGGKPAKPIWFATDGPQLGSIHLLQDRIDAARIAFDGTILARSRRTFPVGTASADTITKAVIAAAGDVLDAGELLGIGVASAGIVDTEDRRVVFMHSAPGLTDLAVGDIVSERYAVPVLFDDYPRVQALGDRWFGAGRGLEAFASVDTGETIGVGTVYRGAVMRGPRGAGGQSGHVIVQVDGAPCRCGKRGCWETIATTGWLRAEAGRLGLPGANEITTGAVAELASNGSAPARELLDRYARNLAVGLANEEQVLASGTYILHGDVRAGGEPFREAIEHWLRELTLEGPSDPPSVVFAEPTDNATLLGAAGLVLSHVFQTRA